MSVNKVRSSFEHLDELPDGFLDACGMKESDGEVEPGGQIIRLQGNGFFVMTNGQVDLPGFKQGHAKIVVCDRIGGVVVNGLLEVIDGFIHPAFLEESVAKAVTRYDVVRLNFKSFPEMN